MVSPTAPSTALRPPATAARGVVRTYHLEPTRQRLLLVVAGSIAGVGVAVPAALLWAFSGLSLDAAEIAVAVIPGVVLLAVAASIVAATRRIRLVLDDDGLELHTFGSTVRTSWLNVASMGLVPFGLLSGEGLRLRVPAQVSTPLLLRLGGVSAPDQWLPLAAFALPLRGSALERDLRARAPHAFAGRLDTLPDAAIF